MPVSCCVRDSDYVNLTCNEYYEKGCTDPLHQIVSESIMMIGSSSLVLAVVQVWKKVDWNIKVLTAAVAF